ncbi:MAG TPA: DUF2269 family protein [Iamia sp.]
MLAAIGSTPYKIVLLLHILSAIVAFAPAMVWPIINVQTRKRGVTVPAEVAGQVPVNNVLVHGPALVLTGVLGILMIVMSEDVWEFSQVWISGAFLVFFALLGVLFGLLVPAERKAATGDADAVRKVSMFGGFVHTLLLVMLYLMIFKPGL